MASTTKTVLITGANGFVGQHLIQELKGDYTICGLTKAANDSSLLTSANIHYHDGDIGDKKFVAGVLKKYRPDYIIHLAARTHTWFTEIQDIFETNVLGTINLYEQVVKLGKSHEYNPRILYVSSSEVYGNTQKPSKITETAECLPVNPYAASKLSADRLSYAYTQSQKLNIVIARPFTHTGPGQALGFFVPDMVSQIVAVENGEQKKLLVGNLDATRDYLDARDVVKAYRLLIETDIKPGEVFNICSGTGVKMKQLLSMLLKYSSSPIELQEDPKRIRPSDVRIFVGDSTKLRSVTGWKPIIPIEQTLADTVAYWRTQHKTKQR